MLYGATRTLTIDPLVTQQKRAQLLTGHANRLHRRQTGADQVAHRLVCCIRHPNSGQQSAPVQDRQTGGVALVVLRPVAAFTRDHRGRDHHAVFPQLGKRAVNTVAAGTGFVAELQRSAVSLAQTLDQLLQRRGGVGKCAIRRGLPTVTRGGDGDDDRVLVYVHADKSCRLFHDPSPVPEAPRRTFRRDPRSSTHDETGHPFRAENGHEVLSAPASRITPPSELIVPPSNAAVIFLPQRLGNENGRSVSSSLAGMADSVRVPGLV